MASNLIRINSRDNVAVAIKPLMKGDVVTVDGDTFSVGYPNGRRIKNPFFSVSHTDHPYPFPVRVRPAYTQKFFSIALYVRKNLRQMPG